MMIDDKDRVPSAGRRGCGAGGAEAERLYELGRALDGGGEHARAADAYARAAEAGGHVSALYNLACCFDQGVGRPRDRQKALELFERAGEAGDADAAYNAAIVHEELGHARDVVRAWYERAAARHHPEALHNLALLQGDSPDLDLTALFKAALSGLPEAQFNYAAACEDAGDYESAAHWWAEAAARGNRAAMYNLGVMHSWGHGVPASKEASTDCFAMAARMPTAEANIDDVEDQRLRTEARFRVGMAHLRGTGTPRSLRKAGRCFYDCAAEGWAPAARELSRLVQAYRPAVPLPCSDPRCTRGGHERPTTRMKLCPGCGGAAYCGAACQKRDWARHRATCRRIKSENAGTLAVKIARCKNLMPLSDANANLSSIDSNNLLFH